jgi:diguanylate cyclase (GGDEF)-like protein
VECARGSRTTPTLQAAIRALELRHPGRPLGGITASFGIALFPDHGSDPVALLLAADRALYEAKAAGRDRASVYAPARVVQA